MLAIERQNAIKKLIQVQRSVTLAQLTTMFEVSSETIRKDLLLLEKTGFLTRTYGGAVCNHAVKKLDPLLVRKQQYIREKQELCSYAVRMIHEGDIIAIDAGSTSLELAKLITTSFSRLTIATHSLEIFDFLSQNPGYELILCGGNYVAEERCFGGPLTVDTIEKLHFHKCFICPSALSLQYGITEYLPNLISVQQSYMRRSDQTYILAYSQRFENGAKIKAADMSSDYIYITDSSLPDEIFLKYQEQNLTVIKE